MDAIDTVVSTVEEWRSELREESRAQAEIGLVLAGVGVVAGIAVLLRWRRSMLAWAIPGALLGTGLALVGSALLETRSERIDEAGALIEAQLEGLDPIARAQVLRRVGQSQFEAITSREG